MAEEPEITTLGDVLGMKQRYRDRLADILGENEDVELLSFMAKGGKALRQRLQGKADRVDEETGDAMTAFIADCSRFFSELQREWLFFSLSLSLPLTPLLLFR